MAMQNMRSSHDANKEMIGDGLYLELCNKMKEVFNETTATKIVRTFRIKLINNWFKLHHTFDRAEDFDRQIQSSTSRLSKNIR